MTLSTLEVARAGADEFRRGALRVALFVAAVLLAVAGGVFHAPAAAAHGGPYEITVSTDGAGGLQVFAHYEEDGHVVEALMDPVAEAVAADGSTAGPVSLISSTEGQGRWVTSEPFLAEGEWTVTVSTTTPEVAETTVEFTVEALEAPPAPPPANEVDSSDASESEVEGQEEVATGNEGGLGGISTLWLVVAAFVVALVGAAALAWKRRRSDVSAEAPSEVESKV